MKFLVRNSVELRLEDYKKSFNKWIACNHVKKLIFVENSGYDLTYFKEKTKSVINIEIEFLSTDENNFYPRELGKGFGESIILKNVIEKSNLEKAGNKRGFKWYKMPSGEVIHLKYSKYYEKNKSYWYGITPESLKYADEYSISHFGFVIGEEGCVIVDLDVMKNYVKNAKTSPNTDDSVRHYHFFIKPGPQPNPFHYNSDEVFECAFIPSD